MLIHYQRYFPQIGGNDQTGNMKTGHELISKMKSSSQVRKVFSLTLPIITSETGEKLGKTAGNAVWLDPERFSPYQFYQFFYNTSDQMAETYLNLFTFLPMNEIADIMNAHRVRIRIEKKKKKTRFEK
jgi:tyrosyl-tRNA synthetase